MGKTILLGDIGGTKCSFALSHLHSRFFHDEKTYISADFPEFGKLLHRVVKNTKEKIDGCILAIAGPVKNNSCTMTNRKWTITRNAVASQLGVNPRAVILVNDFEAVGWGISSLKKSDFKMVKRGTPEKKGTIAVLGAGTGLGESIVAHMTQEQVIPSEGGHSDIAARSKEQEKFVSYLKKKGKGQEYENALSGPGLENIDAFLNRRKLAAAQIATRALEKHDTASLHTLELFATFFAQEAASLALKVKATGGVYIAGGIARKMLEVFKKKHFTSTFNESSKMHELLKKIPVYVITHPNPAHLGMIRLASSLQMK